MRCSSALEKKWSKFAPMYTTTHTLRLIFVAKYLHYKHIMVDKEDFRLNQKKEIRSVMYVSENKYTENVFLST